MAFINVTKSSGVISIRQGTNIPKYYFGIRGTYSALPNNDIQLKIGEDCFTIKLEDLKVNGQSPSTLTTAFTLLNAVLGS